MALATVLIVAALAIVATYKLHPQACVPKEELAVLGAANAVAGSGKTTRMATSKKKRGHVRLAEVETAEA